MMRQVLSEVIQAQRLLTVRYGNATHVVEPYCYGRLWTGEEAVRVYVVQSEGSASLPAGWNLLQLSEIEHITETDSFFDGQRPDFDPYDAAMYFIFSRVERPFGALKRTNKPPRQGNGHSYIWQSRVN